MTFPKLPFLYILWNDAHSPAATDTYSVESVKEVHGSMPILTAGWVLREDAAGVTVASEHCGGSEFRGLTHIPASMVVEIHRASAPKVKRVKNVEGVV